MTNCFIIKRKTGASPNACFTVLTLPYNFVEIFLNVRIQVHLKGEKSNP